MNSLFIVLLLVAIIGLIVGLTNPAVLKLKSRKNVSLVFGLIIIILFFLVGSTSKSNSSQTTSTVVSTETPVSTPTTVSSTPKTTQPATPVPAPKPTPPAPKPQPVVLLNISGSGTKSTQTFTTPSNDWQLDYTYDCSSFGSQGNFQVMVYNQGGSLSDNALVNQLGRSGADTEYYHSGGSYYLEVNSECNWTIRVKG